MSDKQKPMTKVPFRELPLGAKIGVVVVGVLVAACVAIPLGWIVKGLWWALVWAWT